MCNSWRLGDTWFDKLVKRLCIHRMGWCQCIRGVMLSRMKLHSGMRPDEIADLLRMSVYTVRDHINMLFDKVGVQARGELIAKLFL